MPDQTQPTFSQPPDLEVSACPGSSEASVFHESPLLRKSATWQSYEAHILSNIQDAVVVFDESVRLEYVNEAARQLYGVGPDDYGKPGVCPFGCAG